MFLSLESSKYNHIKNYKELDEIVFNETKGIKGKIYLFFDEIQHVNQWEKSINSYRVDLDSDIYISGSNSDLLSGELATHIAGRYVEIKVYPFSFKEVLKYKHEIEGMELTKNSINSLFEDYYLIYGGMPSILSLKNDEPIKSALNDIYNSILFKDIISRFNISNIDLFSRYCEYMINSVGQTFSSKTIKNYLKKQNINTTQNTLLTFNDYLKKTFFISKCPRYDFKGKKMMKIYEKYYLMDHGFHNALIENSKLGITIILETLFMLSF